MQLILISGLAGAGKSTALKILEDSGYNCVDNLPPTMLPQLVEMYNLIYNSKKIAVSLDTRSITLLHQLKSSVQNLKQLGVDTKIIFLEARDEVLIKRFSETRRRHPLSDDHNTISDCIAEEHELLSSISIMAHRIDTSDLSPKSLKNTIKQFVDADYSQLNIIVQSFGFKYGLPIDSDFVFDVRCLPNPYYEKEIRSFNGLEAPVIEFLNKQDKVHKMINDVYHMVSAWINEFSIDNRNYLTISIGCTGGKHRSVFICERIAQMIKADNLKTIIRHRHINQ